MKKMFTVAAIAAIAVTTGLTSCYSDNDSPQVPPTNKGTELTLSGAFASASNTRAFTGMNTYFPTSVHPSAYVYETGETTVPLYEDVTLYPTGSVGNFGDGGSPMYFPTSGENVDVFISYPSLGAAWPTTPVSHTVKATQQTAADYYDSDLVYGGQVDVDNKATMPLDITFFHLMTKVRVAVTAGSGLLNTDLEGMEITINNTLPTAAFTPSTATSVTSVATAGTLSATGTVTDIAITDTVSTNLTSGIKYNDAIIVPQTIDATPSIAFVTVKLTDGETLVYKLTADKTFDPGKVYTYKLTANMEGLTLFEEEIEDWVDGGTESGDLD
jgi:hypothetical protein